MFLKHLDEAKYPCLQALEHVRFSSGLLRGLIAGSLKDTVSPTALLTFPNGDRTGEGIVLTVFCTDIYSNSEYSVDGSEAAEARRLGGLRGALVES